MFRYHFKSSCMKSTIIMRGGNNVNNNENKMHDVKPSSMVSYRMTLIY